jgi:hypothetical protein
MCQFFASLFMQHIIAIRTIRNLDTGSYYFKKMCQFFASLFMQHIIAIGSIRNLDFEQSLKETHSFAPSFNVLYVSY